MKTILLAMAVWALTAAVGYGQVRGVEAGSAEAMQRMQEFRQDKIEFERRMEKDRAEYEKHLESGRSLFGVDKRWAGYHYRRSYGEGKGELAGTLTGKNPNEFKVGDWGCTSYPFQVLSKVSDSECLVQPRYKGSEVMLIRGLDTSKVTDGVEFVLQHPLVIQETYSYTTVAGGQKTVLVLERNDSKLNELAEPARKAAEEARKAAEAARQAAEEALFRNWTDSTGKFSIVAKFIEYKDGRVRLERKDNGKKTDIPLSRLSEEDRKWVHNELKRQRDKKREATDKKPQAKKARGR